MDHELIDRVMYDVKIPLPGSELPDFVLATCTTAESAAEIVRVLLGVYREFTYRIEIERRLLRR